MHGLYELQATKAYSNVWSQGTLLGVDAMFDGFATDPFRNISGRGISLNKIHRYLGGYLCKPSQVDVIRFSFHGLWLHYHFGGFV